MSAGRTTASEHRPTVLEGPVEALIIDLDGTLLDHVGSVHAGLASWLPTLGAERSAELTAAWFRAEERHFADWEAGRIDFAEQRRRRLRDFLPLLDRTPGEPAELDVVFEGFRSAYQRSWVAFDDVGPALVEIARRWPMLPRAVLTNGAETQQRAKLAAIGLAGLLPTVFTAETLGVAKPAAGSFSAVCAALDVAAGRVLHVGDRFDLDVLAARDAGLQAVHLDRLGTGSTDEPLRISSLSELPALLDPVV